MTVQAGRILAFLCIALAAALLMRCRRAHTRRAGRRRLERFLTAAEPMAAMSLQPDGGGRPAPLRARLERAGVAVSARMAAGAFFLLLAAAGAAFHAAGIAAAIVGGLLVGLAGWAVLAWRAAARMRLLSDCMLGFLERLRQLLSVGNSLPGALARAVENSPLIVVQCLAPAMRRIAHGGGVADSLERCAAALDVPELRLLATAVRTNLRFGGSMARTLRGMIETIRARAAVERQLRADTTQIRASAWVLALLPVVVASLVVFTNHTYARWFLETGSGHRMILFCLAFQAAGIWCMRLIVRVRY